MDRSEFRTLAEQFEIEMSIWGSSPEKNCFNDDRVTDDVNMKCAGKPDPAASISVKLLFPKLWNPFLTSNPSFSYTLMPNSLMKFFSVSAT